jgi:ribosomal RNA-processing protein 9
LEPEETLTKSEAFIKNLKVKTSTDYDIIKEDDDLVSKQLKMRMLEKKGKLFYELADQLDLNKSKRVFLKGHKKTPTAIEISPDNKTVFSGGKDCCILKWDLETQKK